MKKLEGIFNFCISIIKLSLGSPISQRVSRKETDKKGDAEKQEGLENMIEEHTNIIRVGQQSTDVGLSPGLCKLVQFLCISLQIGDPTSYRVY